MKIPGAGIVSGIIKAVREFLAPLLAYLLGREQGKNDGEKKVLKERARDLEKENSQLRDDAGLSDAALAARLQRRGEDKRNRED